MELGLEELLVRRDGLVLGDQRGRKRAALGIATTSSFLLVLYAYIAIQGL
jgi:hypothetical protein